MIVAPACFENGCTVWHFEREPGDEPVPQRAIWIDGYLRQISSETETVWLSLALGNFAAKRIVVPGTTGEPVLKRLAEMLGVTVEISDDRPRELGERLYRTTLVRDSLDLFVAALMQNPAHFAIAVPTDIRRIGGYVPVTQIGSNAGFLRRFKDPLDRCGDAATIWMLGPTLALRSVTGFMCAEEFGSISSDAMAAIANDIGLTLEGPFARTSIMELPQALLDLGIAPTACFYGLWERYKMLPNIMGPMYYALRSSLPSGVGEEASLRICQCMAQMTELTT